MENNLVQNEINAVVSDTTETVNTESADKNHPLELSNLNALLDKFGKPKKNNNNNNNNNLNEKISNLARISPPSRAANSYIEKAFKNTLPGKEVDGVDHINISYFAKTRLGRFLDINAFAPFHHRELLNFNSVGGLWYYVKCEEPVDVFRHIHGADCRTEGRKHRVRDVDGFRTIISDATWIKVNTVPEVIADMIESTLPFQNYFYTGELGLKKQTPESLWYIDAVEEIRRTLKEINATGDISLIPDFSAIESKKYQF